MRLPGPSQAPPREAILPMINVVFLLLIFFLMSATIAPPDAFAVQPPEAESEAPAETLPVLLLSAEGVIGYRDLRGDAALEAALDDAVTQIRGDGAADAQQVARLIKRLRSASAAPIVLITQPPAAQ
ncbi:MAG: biopolymer transporter ExbD [Pseudomonadota bacterium]